MGWLFFPFEQPKFLTQDNPIKLWPSLVICLIVFIIRWIVDRLSISRGHYLTKYKINNERPKWLNPPHKNGKTIPTPSTKNGITSSHTNQNSMLSDTEYTNIISLVNTLPDTKEGIKKLSNYASELLTSRQLRELKTYFKLVKEYDLHIHKFLESTFKLVCLVPIALYGTYTVYFKNDFFINHYNIWINDGDPKYEPYDAEIAEKAANCGFVDKGNEPFTQMYDDWMYWYYCISLGTFY